MLVVLLVADVSVAMFEALIDTMGKINRVNRLCLALLLPPGEYRGRCSVIGQA